MRPRLVMLCAALAVTVAAGGLGSGCADSSESRDDSGGSPAAGLASGQTFTAALTDDPGSLNFPRNQGTALQALMPFAYDALVASVGNKIVPGLATRWDVGVRRATFTLRDDVTCSDGTPVTAKTVAENFEYLRRPAVGFPVFGFVNDWRVTADDRANTVSFHFKSPVGFPLQSVADMPIVCGAGLKDRNLLRNRTSGSGPYVLTDVAPNDRYTLTLRDEYAWGPSGVTAKEAGLPAKVVLRVVPDAATRANLLLTGELDAGAIDDANRERLESAGIGIQAPEVSIAQLAFNHADERPTADPAVRRALTMAIDRKAVAKVGNGSVADNLVPPLTNPCPDPGNAAAVPAYDPDAAAAALAEAGWRKGADGIRVKDGDRLTLAAPVSATAAPQWQAAAELITEAWRKLGADVRQRTLANNALVEAISSGAWDVAPMYQVNVPNPATLAAFLSGPTPPNGGNFSAIENDAYTAAVQEALTTPEPAAACERWNEAERALFEQADIVPLMSGRVLMGTGKRTSLKMTTYGIVPTSVRMHAD